jgi:hypothetical protein
MTRHSFWMNGLISWTAGGTCCLRMDCRHKKRGVLPPCCWDLLGNPVLNIGFNPDHKAWSKWNLLREGALGNAGVNWGFREPSCGLDLRKTK